MRSLNCDGYSSGLYIAGVGATVSARSIEIKNGFSEIELISSLPTYRYSVLVFYSKSPVWRSVQSQRGKFLGPESGPNRVQMSNLKSPLSCLNLHPAPYLYTIPYFWADYFSVFCGLVISPSPPVSHLDYCLRTIPTLATTSKH